MPGPGAADVAKVAQDASRSCGQALHPLCIPIRRQMVRLRSSVQIPASHGFPTWAPVCRVTALIPLWHVMNLHDLSIVSAVWDAFQLPVAEVETFGGPCGVLMVAKLSSH
ncbi:hypothetical protein TcCL_NonESM00533 [Trypanosoma cruzi]|nr:hypothetical protein TcCL_NonESM00533 [Trypanosoma cruzi]